MGNSNKEKARQLGMPYGTAANRLRKKILFSLVKEAGLAICYRCKKRIVEIENFTIDHKVPWLYSRSPVAMFFDLDNVAFSHAFCNNSVGRRQVINLRDRIKVPEGKSRCSNCGETKDCVEFSCDNSRWNKCRHWCKDCMKIYQKEYCERTFLHKGK